MGIGTGIGSGCSSNSTISTTVTTNSNRFLIIVAIIHNRTIITTVIFLYLTHISSHSFYLFGANIIYN